MQNAVVVMRNYKAAQALLKAYDDDIYITLLPKATLRMQLQLWKKTSDLVPI